MKFSKESYLNESYIGTGQFERSFSAQKIRARGTIYCAREARSNEIAGMVIMVDYNSKAKLFAGPGEVEMHLLGIKPKFRNHGLGRLLVEKLLDDLKDHTCTKLPLCTRVNMHAAHQLYHNFDFHHIASGDFTKGDRKFLFYEKIL